MERPELDMEVKLKPLDPNLRPLFFLVKLKKYEKIKKWEISWENHSKNEKKKKGHFLVFFR